MSSNISLPAQQGFEWAKGIGGFANGDVVNAIALDTAGNVYIGGSYQGFFAVTVDVDFDPGPGTAIFNSKGDGDAYIAKYDDNGNYIWAMSIGGSSGASDAVSDIAFDAVGNVYVTGWYRGAGFVDFDPGPDTAALPGNFTDDDIFIAKYDASGNYLWVKGIGAAGSGGGAEDDRGRALAVDAAGNIYVTGSFGDTVDFDPGPGIANLTSPGTTGIFVLKLDAGGNYIWAKSMNGDNYERASDIALDASGNLYLSGSFWGIVDFDPGTGTANLTSTSYDDLFIAKYDASGNYIWARNMNTGTATDQKNPIAVDGLGNVYVTGGFGGTVDFNPGAGVFNLATNTTWDTDAFILKLNSSGNFVWAHKIGQTSGTGVDAGNDIRVDASGDIYTTGTFSGTVDFDPGTGTTNLTANGGADIYISRLDTAGNLIWAKGAGHSPGNDGGKAVVSDAAGNVHVAGYFGATVDFDPGPDTAYVTSNGNNDIFILKLSQCSNTDATITQTACDSFTLNSQTYAVSGVYTQILANAGGCDSIITLNLTINHSSTGSLTVTACDSFSFNNKTYSASGNYIDTFVNASGCDSFLTLSLTINTTTGSSLTHTACRSFTFNDSTYTQSGIYTQTLANATGCDSIITLDLTINTVETGVTQNNALLTANASGAVYQWINCNNNAPVAGATARGFTATADGSYAVIVFQNGCSDTSGCYTVTGLSIHDLGKNDTVQVYPNPASGKVRITTTRTMHHATVRLTNTIGQILQERRKINGNDLVLDISNYAPGIYIIEIQEGNAIVRVKLVKA